MLGYPKLKKLAIDLLDDFYDEDLLAQYGPGGKYNAKTKLDAIEVVAVKRAAMVPRVNKVMGAAAADAWRDVRPVDTVKAASIGDFIKLLCKHAQVALPDTEPK